MGSASEDSQYQQVIRGGLKLKGDALKEVNPDGSRRKRRKKVRRHSELEELEAAQRDGTAQVLTLMDLEKVEDLEREDLLEEKRQKTDAEKMFEKRRKQLEKEEAKKLAKESYREKIAKFNAHISKLSEHHDIPRVGPG